MAGENLVSYSELDSSNLYPSASPSHWEAANKPTEDCISGDDSARVLVDHCDLSIASLSRLMIGKCP